MDPLSQPSLLFDRHSSQTSPQWEEEEFCWRGRSADVRCFGDARFFHSHVFLNFGVGTKRTILLCLLSTPMSCLFFSFFSPFFFKACCLFSTQLNKRFRDNGE